MTAEKKSLPERWLSTKLYYGSGSVAYGIKDQGFSYMLLLFYNQVLGLPAAWVGAAILIALVVDAISDPLVGNWSDKLHSRWGRRHPFMYASIVPVAVSFWYLWNPPADLQGESLFAYLVVLAVLVRTFITFYEIPSSALAPELTEDYDERTSILSFRFFFGWWGGLTMTVVAFGVVFTRYASEAQPAGQLVREGWQDYAWIAAITMAVAVVISTVGTHRHIPHLRKPPARRPFDPGRTLAELRQTLSNRSFLALLASGLFQAVAVGLSTSLNFYFSTYFWELSAGQIATVALGPYLSAALALALAPVVSRTIGKKKGAIAIWIAATIGAPLLIVLRLAGLMPENGSPLLVPVIFVHGVIEVTLIVISSILISAMIADVVEDSELKTGRRSEGMFFAARSFIGKAVHGLGVVAATSLLTFVGFPEGVKPGEVSVSVIRDLGLYYSPALLVLYAIAIACLGGYRIERAEHEANLKRLADTAASAAPVPEPEAAP